VRERGHFEDQGIDGRKLDLQHSIGERGGCIDWIYLAQDRERCWALVNMVVNRQVP